MIFAREGRKTPPSNDLFTRSTTVIGLTFYSEFRGWVDMNKWVMNVPWRKGGLDGMVGGWWVWRVASLPILLEFLTGSIAVEHNNILSPRNAVLFRANNHKIDPFSGIHCKYVLYYVSTRAVARRRSYDVITERWHRTQISERWTKIIYMPWGFVIVFQTLSLHFPTPSSHHSIEIMREL